MIAYLEGSLLEKKPDQALIKVGGVGYLVLIPLSTFYQLPDPPAPVTLFIQTIWQSDNLLLCGFATREEKETFSKLLAIPRIGPRLALNILSGISPQELAQAVLQGDVKRLAAVPGLGRKSAERILVELKGKLPASWGEDLPSTPTSASLWDDALSALVNLGYPRSQAEEVLRQLSREARSWTLEEILRSSLGRLTPLG